MTDEDRELEEAKTTPPRTRMHDTVPTGEFTVVVEPGELALQGERPTADKPAHVTIRELPDEKFIAEADRVMALHRENAAAGTGLTVKYVQQEADIKNLQLKLQMAEQRAARLEDELVKAQRQRDIEKNRHFQRHGALVIAVSCLEEELARNGRFEDERMLLSNLRRVINGGCMHCAPEYKCFATGVNCTKEAK